MPIKIVVFGAGVSGLTTALELKKANSEYDITVVGQHLPGDIDTEYVSPFAGANWHSFAGHDDKFLQELDSPGYWKFLELAESEPTSGVWSVDNVSLSIKQSERDEGDGNKETNFNEYLPWFKDFVEEFRILRKEELPEGIEFGTSFKGVVITTPIYLNFLLRKNIEFGNAVRRVKRTEDIEQALYYHSSGEKADFVINASGLMVRNLKGVNDFNRNFPVKGQVLHVRNNARVELSIDSFAGYENEMLYIMPRKEGGSIIGGCFFADDEDITPNPELIERTIQRAKKYAPEMFDPNFKQNPTEIDIIRVNVGLRPFREGGARVEADYSRRWLFHNYGYGGGGYQGSFGGAEIIVGLVKNAVASKELTNKL